MCGWRPGTGPEPSSSEMRVVDHEYVDTGQMDRVDRLKRNSAMKLASFPGHSSAANGARSRGRQVVLVLLSPLSLARSNSPNPYNN
ncbi:hypothetical protein MTP99_013311 [Tenebrio molitor]|jgi:hypothetical protein|nr:hypothetical protein MTP99_013311 [Tenebrio molitor]